MSRLQINRASVETGFTVTLCKNSRRRTVHGVCKALDGVLQLFVWRISAMAETWRETLCDLRAEPVVELIFCVQFHLFRFRFVAKFHSSVGMQTLRE